MLRRAPGLLIATVLSCIAVASLASAARAVTLPDLTVSTSNSVSGATTLGNTWTWTLHVANPSAGAAAATFNSGDTILIDDLDAGSGSVRYDTQVAVKPDNTSGPILCTIAAGYRLTCIASGGIVRVWGGGSFDVTVTADPTSIGLVSTPRLFGSCMVDPGYVVTETNESNDVCQSDSVAVTAPISRSGNPTMPPARSPRGAAGTGC